MHAVGVGGGRSEVFTFTDGRAAARFAEWLAKRCKDPIRLTEVGTRRQRAGLKACVECGAVFSRLGPDGVTMTPNQWFRKTYCTRECNRVSRDRETYGRQT